MRISRPCYDKMHRCPGSNGGGLKYAKKELCSGGYVSVDYDRPLWKFRANRCNRCDVIVLPWAIRWVDPSYWKHGAGQIPRRIRWWVEEIIG